MSAKHDHMSKPAPRVSPAMELPGRPSAIAPDGVKSVHANRSHPRSGVDIHEPADRTIGDGHAGGAPGSNDALAADTGWVPPATGNPAFGRRADTQAAMFIARQTNRAGRKPL